MTMTGLNRWDKDYEHGEVVFSWKCSFTSMTYTTRKIVSLSDLEK